MKTITYDKNQERIFNHVITTNKHLAISSTAGSGKCLKFDTPVLMYSGEIKKVQDVVVGDQLMGPDSKPRNVLSLARGQEKMYDVIPTKGDVWGCNESHIFSLRASYSACGYAKDDVVDMPLVDWRALPNHIRHQFKQYRIGVEFKHIKTIIDPYLLGVWIGDGSKQDGSPIFSINSKDVECLVANNQVSIPRKYLVNSRWNRLQLLAGLLDTDGHYAGGYYELTTKYEALKDDILFLARSLGFYCGTTYKKSTIKEIDFVGYYWRLSICGDISDIPCLIARKKANVRKQKKNVLNTGFKIQSIGVGEYYGFEIDGDHRFLLGDFTVTHNTTTIVQCANIIPYNKSSIFTAFNKHTVKELTGRLPTYTQCSTMHSLGWKCLKKHFAGDVSMIGNQKQINFIEPFFDRETNMRKKWKSILSIDWVMRLARAHMADPNRTSIEAVMQRHALEIDDLEMGVLIRALRKIKDYNYSATYNINIDFQDMVELVATLPVRTPVFDYVFIDEAQDMSELDRLFLSKMVKPITGRRIIAGDRRQAIYSFRGADVYSFDAFIKESNTIELPLNVSYRCSKAVVAEAQKIYPEIQPWDQAEEGCVREGSLNEVTEDDMILCRNNKPLALAMLYLIERGISCYIVGKDMEKGLLKLTAGYNDDAECQHIWLELKEREEGRVSRELAAKGVKNIAKHPKFDALQEKLAVLFVLFQKFQYIYEVEQFIYEMFEEESEDANPDNRREGCRLMTIHKSKGLENDRVFLIRSFDSKMLIPSQYAITEEQLIAEKNLEFVATTRAKKELIYIDL